jgi:AcrR family transcriptional regulator
MRSRRDRYHHGDLRNALVAAATELARAGGPEAVVLREAARRVGVSATAAYRHFDNRQDLLLAVKLAAQERLADAMAGAVAAGAALSDRGEEAERRLLAMARGYIGFALAEPGLYRSAFQHQDLPPKEPGRHPRARSYAMLAEVLDELLAAGRMPASRRPYAEIAAWSPLHGLCLMFLDGSLALPGDEQRDEVIERVLDVVAAGLRHT